MANFAHWGLFLYIMWNAVTISLCCYTWNVVLPHLRHFLMIWSAVVLRGDIEAILDNLTLDLRRESDRSTGYENNNLMFHMKQVSHGIFALQAVPRETRSLIKIELFGAVFRKSIVSRVTFFVWRYYSNLTLDLRRESDRSPDYERKRLVFHV